MSSKNNVNPDHYKIAGRDRQGENVVHDRQKQSLGLERARLSRRKAGATPKSSRRGEREGGAEDEE